MSSACTVLIRDPEPRLKELPLSKNTNRRKLRIQWRGQAAHEDESRSRYMCKELVMPEMK